MVGDIIPVTIGGVTSVMLSVMVMVFTVIAGKVVDIPVMVITDIDKSKMASLVGLGLLESRRDVAASVCVGMSALSCVASSFSFPLLPSWSPFMVMVCLVIMFGNANLGYRHIRN